MELIGFFNSPFFIVIGGISTLFTILIIMYTIVLVVKGVFSVWYRLGLVLSKRKIAVFAEGQKFNELKNLLLDSDLFIEKNIEQIDQNSIKKAENFTLLLVYFMTFREKIDEILAVKRDKTALIIYMPHEDGRIEEDVVKKINSHRNSIIVNMRGRLLNDIFTVMITSGYEKR